MSASAITAVRKGKLACLEIRNSHAVATLSLWGGQLLSFRPADDDRERLFLSPAAHLDGEHSIRGGIPVCWPWFGAATDPALPAHGFVRRRQWQLLDSGEQEEHSWLLLAPESTQAPGFAGDAELQLRIKVGRTLELSLQTRNIGSEPFQLGAALHSYFLVGDVRDCRLQGLQGTYSDKTRDWQLFDTPAEYRLHEETDRIHLHASPVISIVENTMETLVQSAGHDSIVVWNPWAGSRARFPDLEDDGWRRMLCVETALTQGFMLAPGAEHTLTQVVT